MVYLGYKMVNGKHNGAVTLKTDKAVAKFVVGSMEDKVITDELDNLVLNTYGIFINYINPAYMQLRDLIIQEQQKLGI